MKFISGNLVPACGGTEQPFTVNGVRWQYCWDPESGRHAYLNLDTDLAVFNREFHPVWAPEKMYEEDISYQPKTKPVHPAVREGWF